MANNFGLHFRYYSNKVLKWSMDNKMILFLGLLSFCLFVSTLVLASQRNSAQGELSSLQASLQVTSTDATVETTTGVDSTTDAPTSDSSDTTPVADTTTVETTTNDSGNDTDTSGENKSLL